MDSQYGSWPSALYWLWFLAFVEWIAMAFVVAYVARQKGRSGEKWLAAAMLFSPLFAILCLCALPVVRTVPMSVPDRTPATNPAPVGEQTAPDVPAVVIADYQKLMDGVPEAMRLAQERWGKWGSARVLSGRCQVGVVTSGYGFEVRGDGTTWQGAFEDATSRPQS